MNSELYKINNVHVGFSMLHENSRGIYTINFNVRILNLNRIEKSYEGTTKPVNHGF